MDYIILMALKDRAMSGYDVISFVYDRFQVLLSPGTTYPALESMERKGLIEGVQTHRKKLYKVTTKGEAISGPISIEYMKFHSQLQLLWRLAGQPG